MVNGVFVFTMLLMSIYEATFQYKVDDTILLPGLILLLRDFVSEQPLPFFLYTVF